MSSLSELIRTRRLKLGLTQEDVAQRAGVGLRLIRELEQETKGSFRVDKVNQVLALFGYELGPVPKPKRD